MMLYQNSVTMTTLGDYIKTIREEKRFTQRELAQKSGFSHGAIQKIENGTTQHPGIDVLLGLSKALRVKIDILIAAYQGIDPQTLPEDNEVILEESIKEFMEWRSQNLSKKK